MSGHIESVKQRFKSLNLTVGIDQESTSKKALEEILNLVINKLYANAHNMAIKIQNVKKAVE